MLSRVHVHLDGECNLEEIDSTITLRIRKMMMNRWIVKWTLREAMILGILKTRQRDPSWVVK
jgi:hypothetical protein